MRSRITRRLVIALAVAALAVPAGIAVATPPSSGDPGHSLLTHGR